MTSITAIQEKYVALYNDIPVAPGRYGCNRRSRVALKGRFYREMRSLVSTYTDEQLSVLWSDVRDMASLLDMSEVD